jgi:hypothetical protein
MKVTFEFEVPGNTMAEAADFMSTVFGAAPKKPTASPTETTELSGLPVRKGPGKKEKKAAPLVEPDLGLGLEEQASEPENTPDLVLVDEDEEDDGLPPAKPAKKAKPLTLEDVIAKFSAYVETHDREKAKKILGRYGCKSIRELKPEQYAEVLKVLDAE